MTKLYLTLNIFKKSKEGKRKNDKNRKTLNKILTRHIGGEVSAVSSSYSHNRLRSGLYVIGPLTNVN